MSQGRELHVVALTLSSLNDFGECFELELVGAQARSSVAPAGARTRSLAAQVGAQARSLTAQVGVQVRSLAAQVEDRSGMAQLLQSSALSKH